LVLHYLTDALKDFLHVGHLKRPTLSGFLPFGDMVQVFSGFSTSVPHAGHFAMKLLHLDSLNLFMNI